LVVIGGDWHKVHIERTVFAVGNLLMWPFLESRKSVGACKTYNIRTLEGTWNAPERRPHGREAARVFVLS
jgi:hypothetical protein